MRYEPLGTSDLLVSTVGLGCNNFGGRIGAEATQAVVHAAIDAGITLFDTADIYGNGGGSESLLGEALAGGRDQIVLATKFGFQQFDMGYPAALGAKGSRAYVRHAVEQSLRRLGTDRIDLYQLHTPDPVTPIEETLAALHELVLEGKVRHLGHSNLAGWQIADAAHVAAAGGLTPFVSAQNEYSLLERDAEREVIPAVEQFGLGLLPYYPLARGLLTGKVTREHGIPDGTRLASAPGYVTADRLDRVEALRAWAEEHGHTLLEVAFGGLSARQSVASVIAGATKPEQVAANVAAGQYQPTAADLAEIDAIVPGPSSG